MSNRPEAETEGWYIELGIADTEGAAGALDAFEAALDDPAEPVAISRFRDEQSGGWTLRAVQAARPDEDLLHARLAIAAAVAGQQAVRISVARLPATDWVAEVNRNTPPIAAGRFFVRGTHVTGPSPPGSIEVVLDAGQAFGSGSHESTRGCLLGLDRARAPTAGMILDLGTGSGILAIAAAKLWKRLVLATDLDPVSVVTAQENAARNGVASLIETRCSRGFSNPVLRHRSPYGLIMANILAAPIIRLAPRIAKYLHPDGKAILSGLLVEQAGGVAEAYAESGLAVCDRIALGAWSTLVVEHT